MAAYKSLVAACFLFLLFPSSGVCQCEAPASWFPHESTPEPDFSAPTSNCEFHQWAWQEFLWLTQESSPGRIRLQDLPTEDLLFSPGRAPAPLNKSWIQRRLKTQALRLFPRTRKSTSPTSVGHIRQAGSHGVLVDKNGNPVYYASFVSPEYYEFVRKNKLFLRKDYLDAADDLNFPTKAVELKSAWSIVPEGQSSEGFFTTKALVPSLTCLDGNEDCVGPNVVVDMTKLQEVTVALVGLHVVGVVEDHPEFIWSTFEHIKNAPNLANGDPTGDDSVSPADWTFYQANTPAKLCNVPNSGTVQLDGGKSQLSPVTNVFRQFEFGGGNRGDTNNIKSLNQSVHQQLAEDSVWRNYRLVGGVWFQDGDKLVPGLNRNTIQQFVVGSTKVSNSTMETFTQRPIGPTMPTNCFSCHGTDRDRPNRLPAKNLNISHILKQGLVEREEMELLAANNLSHKDALVMHSKGLELNDIPGWKSMNLFSMPTPKTAPTALSNYADVQNLLDTFVADNNVPMQFSPHGAFWTTMSHDQFTTGNIPGVLNPDTGEPLKVMVAGNSAGSNIIMSLRGTAGSIFDPATGSIGRMPPSGPFMTSPEIDRLAAWIDAGAPN